MLERKKGSWEYTQRPDGECETWLTSRACSEPPEGHAPWTVHMISDRLVELGGVDLISHECVRQVLQIRLHQNE